MAGGLKNLCFSLIFYLTSIKGGLSYERDSFTTLAPKLEETQARLSQASKRRGVLFSGSEEWCSLTETTCRWFLKRL